MTTAADELVAFMDKRKWSAAMVAALFQVDLRKVRRWRVGELPIPQRVLHCLRTCRVPDPNRIPRSVAQSLEAIGWRPSVPARKLACDVSLVRTWVAETRQAPDAVLRWLDMLADAVQAAPAPTPEEWRQQFTVTASEPAVLEEPKPVPVPVPAPARKQPAGPRVFIEGFSR